MALALETGIFSEPIKQLGWLLLVSRLPFSENTYVPWRAVGMGTGELMVDKKMVILCN